MTSTLVLIHGWGFGPAVWEPVTSILPGVEIYRPPLPGYAAGSVVRETAEGDWLDRWSAAWPAQAVVVGWSLGALIALRVAHRYPDRVRALGLIAGLPYFMRQRDWAAGWTAAALAAVRRRLMKNPDAARRYVAALAARGDTQSEQVREALLNTPVPAVEALHEGLACLAETDARDILAALDLPVTIWLGDRDQLIGSDCRPVLEALQPRAQVRELPGAGHAPFISQAGVMAGELEALL